MEDTIDLTEAKEPDPSLVSPPPDLLVLELIPPTPCPVCGEVLHYGTVEQKEGYSHRVIALHPYTGFSQQPRPAPAEPDEDGRVRPYLYHVPLAETTIPNGTNLRIVTGRGQHDAVLIIKREPPDGPDD